MPPNPSNAKETPSASFNEPPITSAEAGIAAVVFMFNTTLLSPLPDPTEPGVNEHVLSAGNPEQVATAIRDLPAHFLL
jgi:hypothetical protein